MSRGDFRIHMGKFLYGDSMKIEQAEMKAYTTECTQCLRNPVKVPDGLPSEQSDIGSHPFVSPRLAFKPCRWTNGIGH